MDTVAKMVRSLRQGAGLSQRALARRAGTSQPAIARYERGVATPSWDTLQRLAHACGRRVLLSAEPVADPHDVDLAAKTLALTPQQRLQALRRYAHLRRLSSERE